MRWLGTQIIELEACGSTNDEAARLARAGASHGTVIIAQTQTAGRGREGRVWQSPPGSGLYLSAVVRPPLPLATVPPLTLAIGVGACEAVRHAGVAAELKWPNDLVVAGTPGAPYRKLGGILVESQSQGTRLDAVIVGIGINLEALPLDLDPTRSAISLAEASATPIARPAFVTRLLGYLELWIDRYIAGGLPAVIPTWHAYMAAGVTARVTIDGAPVVGQVTGVDSEGALLLRDADARVHRVRSGDVQTVR